MNIRVVDTELSQKTDQNGHEIPLAEPLCQDLTFRKMAQGEDKIKGNLLRAFLQGENFAENESVGRFTADLKGHLNVTASIFSYGLTENWTVAIAVPYYQAATSVNVGFKPNATANAFLAALNRTENNQTAAAREAGDKLNHAVLRLNDKLRDHGYSELQDWSSRGLGDITIASKNRPISSTYFALASTTGVVAPTGRVDDPDILTDIPFGDGQWDLFGQLAMDETIIKNVTLNQFAKYTWQLPGKKSIRAVTDDEKIEVEKKEANFKLGDKIDAGASLQWQPTFGLVTGVGINYAIKYGDRYTNITDESAQTLQNGTDQYAKNAEITLGYSTVPAYQSGHMPVPLEIKFSYTQQLASRNLPMTNLAQMDFNLFF